MSTKHPRPLALHETSRDWVEIYGTIVNDISVQMNDMLDDWIIRNVYPLGENAVLVEREWRWVE